MVYSTDRSKSVVPKFVLLFVVLLFILRGGLFCGLPCVVFFLCFSVLLALRLLRLGRRELVFVLFVRLFDFARVWLCPLFLPLGTPWTFLLLFFICPVPPLNFCKLIAGKIGVSTKSKKAVSS